MEALSNARSLRSLKLRVRWLSTQIKAFTMHDAAQMMLHDENSRLRSIGINNVQFNVSDNLPLYLATILTNTM